MICSSPQDFLLTFRKQSLKYKRNFKNVLFEKYFSLHTITKCTYDSLLFFIGNSFKCTDHAVNFGMWSLKHFKAHEYIFFITQNSQKLWNNVFLMIRWTNTQISLSYQANPCLFFFNNDDKIAYNMRRKKWFQNEHFNSIRFEKLLF